MKLNRLLSAALFAVLIVATPSLDAANGKKSIVFGSDIDAKAQVAESRRLAKKIASDKSLNWNRKGDQRLTYYFDEAGESLPFRVCVPDGWDGKSKLPMVVFLHGAWNTESSYLDEHDKLMVKIANQHNVLLVSPLGAHAAYGTDLKLPAVFGNKAEIDKMIAQEITAERAEEQRISEKDVINVIEIVLAHFPVDRKHMFLTGHSMGSGGTWYLGAKYSDYWCALAPMSGPFLSDEGYPWENLRRMPLFVTEGTISVASLESSRDLYKWLQQHGFDVIYKEVAADHPGMVPLVLPDVYDFFDECIGK